MPNVDYNFYMTVYLGEPIAESEFPRYLARAEEAVNQMTRYQIPRVGFSNMPEALQELVKRALCAQVEYLAQNGIETAQTGRDADSWTVGKVHVGGGGVSTSKTMFSPSAMAMLEQTGLMSRRVAVI